MNDDLKRLNEVRELLGLDAAGSDAQQRAALPKIAEWLRTGGDEPAVALRAAQLLLADGEFRGGAVEGVVKPLRDLLPEEWGNLATPSQKRLLALQCLVLASWDASKMTRDGYRALALAASPWRVLPSRNGSLRDCIAPLLAACSEPELTPNDPVELPSFEGAKIASPKAAAAIDGPTFDQNLATVPNTPQQTAVNGTALVAMLRQQMDAISGLRAVEHTNATSLRSAVLSLQTALTDWVADVNKALGGERLVSPTEEMLWWGQARYCYHHRKPLRGLSSHAAIRWWAAYELAQRATAPQCEPAASFLVETLITLGVAAAESRTLHDWASELHGLLRGETNTLPSVSRRLMELAEECAIGLPVTWVRLHHAKPFNASALADATGLNLDAAVTSWQWSSWLLRECMLEHFLQRS